MAFEDDRPSVVVGGIALKHTQPDVSVSTSARHKDIEVLGDTTIRQKLGTSPDEISISGICTQDEANQIDQLVFEETVTVISSRWDGEAQVTSTNTDPLAEGGAISDGEWTHTFTIELTGVPDSIDIVRFDAP